MRRKIFIVSALLMFFSGVCMAQSTSFNYQGNLKSGGVDANGSHDFEFALFDAASGGAQLGATVTQSGVTVTNGTFAAVLDFGNQFPGAGRFLEIRVRQAGGGAFTPMTPRQQILSTPYAVKSLSSDTSTTSANAAQLGGVAASQYVVTGDTRLSDARTPTAGSSNYIQNQIAVPQAASNFNISGSGSANVLNAVTQYNLSGSRILSSALTSNLFVGAGAGQANPTGNNNSFFGFNSGQSNTNGNSNSFFGDRTGQNNSGSGNSFFGHQSGFLNTTGGSNAFFGMFAGVVNTDGNFNSFFGAYAANANQHGEQNTFLGMSAGINNTNGNSNTFVGMNSGASNTLENNNTFVGSNSDGLTGINNATSLGSRAKVTQNNSLVLGSINGVNGASADTNVGIGTTAPVKLLQVKGVGSDGAGQTDFRVTGSGAIAAGITIESTGLSGRTYSWLSTADNIAGGGTGPGRLAAFDVTAGAYRMVIDATGNMGIGTISPQDKLDVNGVLRVGALGSAGATALCRNASNQISTCSSSKRYKSNISSFNSGLVLIRQLRPVSFNWKDGGMADMGLVAEDVAAIEPLLTTTNDTGEVEGVKYDRIGVVMINAIKEQQSQIDSQQKLINKQDAVNKSQQADIAALKALVCVRNRRAAACKSK